MRRSAEVLVFLVFVASCDSGSARLDADVVTDACVPLGDGGSACGQFDAGLIVDAGSIVDAGVDAATAPRIASIVGMGPAEMVWDWELYHDPAAVTYRDTGGMCNTFDGPFHPWRGVGDRRYVMTPNPCDYRVPLTATLGPARALNAADIAFNSSATYPAPDGKFYHRGQGMGWLAGSCTEADYDNRMWIFGIWTEDGSNLYAVAHHEFYPETCPAHTTHPWVNSLHHLVSSDGGATFRPAAYTPYLTSGSGNASRLILTPEPYARANPVPRDTSYVSYGFFHPSNLVREGAWIYALVEGRFFLQQEDPAHVGHGLHEAGFVMVRTADVTQATGWELYTATGWHLVNHSNFQGLRGQMPKLWYPQNDYSPYDVVPQGGQNLSFSLVQYQGSGQWIALGYSAGGGHSVAYSLSDSLAQPDWGPIQHITDVPNLAAGNYPSLVDPTSSSRVYKDVGGTPYLYFVAKNGSKPFLPIAPAPSNALSRSIYRIPVKIQ